MATTKTAISLPQDLFQELERAARGAGVSRSSLLAEALRQYLERRRNQEILAKLAQVYSEPPTEEERAEQEAWLRASKRAIRQQA